MMKKRNKILLGIVAVWVIGMAVASPRLVKAWHQKKAMDQTFADYTGALTSGRWEVAYGFADTQFSGTTSLQEFVAQHKELATKFGDLKAIEQGQTRVDGKGTPPRWSAEIYADLHYQNGTVPMVYWFRNPDGRWRLVGYRRRV
jgi:hypothetical protein